MREVPKVVKEMMVKYGVEFREIFDTELSQFIGKLWIVGIADFDIVKFERFLEKVGYVPGDGKQSMAEFVKMRYGEEGSKLIDKLLTMDV